MGSPEAFLVAAEAGGTPEAAFEELTGSLQGWKRKQSMKKGATPKKDMIYVAPDGHEIKSKRQLEKYLKVHSGTLSGSDFEWGVPAADAVTSTENRRRSARLSSKGGSSAEGLEESSRNLPVVKRSRKSRENGQDESDVASKGGVYIPADNSQLKEEGNGEGKRNTKAMDVDVCKLEVRSLEEIKGQTTTRIIKAKDEKLVFGAINSEKQAKIPTRIDDLIDFKGEGTPSGYVGAVKLNGELNFSPPHGLLALVGEIPEPQEVGCILASATVV